MKFKHIKKALDLNGAKEYFKPLNQLFLSISKDQYKEAKKVEDKMLDDWKKDNGLKTKKEINPWD